MRNVCVTEVGMRDGFQMESTTLPLPVKLEIGLALIAAGLRRIEATSFVSPRRVPQLADASELVRKLRGHGAILSALTPNLHGAERAIDAGADELVIFVSASETHNLRNLRCTIAASLLQAQSISAVARGSGVSVRGAISTAFGCPFEGEVDAAQVLRVAECYAALGVVDISLADTTGMATPRRVKHLCTTIARHLPEIVISLHFHNTRGLGLANVIAGLECGIDRYESSIGGLGGCPFAVGATGNVCTEDLIHMLHEEGYDTGIDLAALISVAKRVEALFGRILPGQVMKAGPRLSRPGGASLQTDKS